MPDAPSDPSSPARANVPVVTRFAPSPTGALHLGHARAALVAHGIARRLGGRFLLRFEDIDPGRCDRAHEATAVRDLAWLGLDWDAPPRRQSEHLDLHAAALDRLRAAGLLYPCFCTRGDIARGIAASVAAPHAALQDGPDAPGRDPDGAALYPGTCRHLAAQEREARLAQGAPHAWRLDMARAADAAGPLAWRRLEASAVACDPRAYGDVVLARKDVPTSYHLAVTCDDAATGVTLVTRADDLAPATAVHRLLQVLLGLPDPAYAFFPLMRDAAGRRLAKRDGAVSLERLRAEGATPGSVADMTGAASLVDLALTSARNIPYPA